MARPTKSKALDRLQKILEGAADIRQEGRKSAPFEKWRRNAQVAITNTFGDNSNNLSEFNSISFSPGVYFSRMPDSHFQQAFSRGMASAESMLESMIEEIQEYWDDDLPSSSQANLSEKPFNQSNKVFVIHGRNQATREKVARFLEKLELIPVILHEQPNSGRTIIEKFEDYADVGFAVVLLTADDVGGLTQEETDLMPRARQNVVFEFGYFIGKLGRDKVCALVQESIERPSDCDGLVYVHLDERDSWNMELIRELMAAGLKIDTNKFFQP